MSKQKIVLIGAGSTNFGLGTLGDIFKSNVLAGSHIVLHDINATALQQVENIAQRALQEHNFPYTISATTSRTEALQGALLPCHACNQWYGCNTLCKIRNPDLD